MIGAAGAAAGANAAPPTFATTGAAPATAAAAEAGCSDFDATPSADAPANAAAAGRPRHTETQQDRPASAKGAGYTDFAALLAEQTGDAVVTAAPTVAGAGFLESDRIDANADPAVPSTGLPDQLLALLGGTWTTAATPASGPQPAQSGDTAAIPSFAAEPANTALAGPVAAMPASGGVPAPVAEAITPALETMPATGAATGEPGAPSTANDASAPFPVLPAVSPAPVAASDVKAAASAPIAVPVDPEQGFDDGFGARLVWMAEQRLGHAEIRLNPEHLGPIDVRVRVDGTQVSAEFSSAHASVRQAIEASVPRLRDLLGQQGLQLGHADVGHRHSGSGHRAPQHGESNSPSNTRVPSDVTMRSLRSRGLLDEYA